MAASWLGKLWLHADFRRLWAGQTVSAFGMQISLVAFPLVAVLTLEATPAQMGLLGALGYAPLLQSVARNPETCSPTAFFDPSLRSE